MTATKPPTPRTEKRQSLQFPMIPPLRSTITLDKENQRQTSVGSVGTSTGMPPKFTREAASPLRVPVVVPDSALAAAAPSTATTPFGSSHSRSPHQSPSVFGAVASSSSSNSTSRLARRVLRYGETMESLFALDEESTDEHWKLARSIADGSAADDAKAWRRILHLVSQKAQEKGARTTKGTFFIFFPFH